LIGFDAQKLKPAGNRTGKLLVPQDQELHHPADIAVDYDLQNLLVVVRIIGRMWVPVIHIMGDQPGLESLFDVFQLGPEQGLRQIDRCRIDECKVAVQFAPQLRFDLVKAVMIPLSSEI
jgi:hypothetical protein